MKNIQNAPVGRLSISGRNLLPSVIQIRAMASQCRLFVREPRKISADFLLFSLMSAIAFGEKSARAIALELGICCNVSVSRQAVWQRLSQPAITAFIQKTIDHVMGKTLEKNNNHLLQLRESISNLALPTIARVLIGDASTFTMHPSLAAVFPGSKNGKPVPKAHLKLQLIADLLTGKWVQFSIDYYGRSDAKAALDFMSQIKKGDLLIRDLGYAVMAAFKEIIEHEAYFISRLKARVYVLDPKTEERLELIHTLRCLAPKPGDTFRMPVLMTESDKIPCEMIAERVPDSVANERRRRLNAKHKEQGFKPPSKRYLKLQDWTVLVTNVKEADVSNSNIIRWYKMRWRIELIFKACKSHTGMLKIVGHKTNQHHAKALVLTWVLAMIILADRGCFAMANLCEEGGRSDGNARGVNTEIGWLKIEICSTSIFKSISRMILGFGFQIELAGAGMNLEEHWERTFRFHKKHNQTESQKNRTALFEILDSAMIIPS